MPLFKHHSISPSSSVAPATDISVPQQTAVSPKEVEVKPTEKKPDVTELMEKNLKWSQIIYEQNRKINHKLFWLAIGSWVRIFIIVVPLVLAVLYAPTLYRQFEAKYGSLLQRSTSTRATGSPSSVQDLLKVLPLNDAQREQLKTILK